MKQYPTAAIRIAKLASVLLKKRFDRSGTKTHRLKAHSEIVTSADLAANNLITKELLKAFPTHDIISEEKEKIDNPSELTWYVDPLDGTTNFSYGIAHYATCIGLYDAAKSQILTGAIGLPEQNEIFSATAGKGAYRNNRKLTVSKTDKLLRAMVMGCAGYSDESRANFQKIFNAIFPEHVRLRIMSCAGAELAAVAAGNADVAILTDIHAWDVLPGVLLIREAGGKVTTVYGKQWEVGDTSVIAANPKLHKKLIKLITKAL